MNSDSCVKLGVQLLALSHLTPNVNYSTDRLYASTIYHNDSLENVGILSVMIIIQTSSRTYITRVNYEWFGSTLLFYQSEPSSTFYRFNSYNHQLVSFDYHKHTVCLHTNDFICTFVKTIVNITSV